jgi:hypothetical protein
MEGRPQTKYSQIIGLELMGLCLGVDVDQLGVSLERRPWEDKESFRLGLNFEADGQTCGDSSRCSYCASCMVVSLSAQSVWAMMGREVLSGCGDG